MSRIASLESGPKPDATRNLTTGVDPAKLTTFTRADGSTQSAFDGHPLYFFANDKKAGDTKGEDLEDDRRATVNLGVDQANIGAGPALEHGVLPFLPGAVLKSVLVVAAPTAQAARWTRCAGRWWSATWRPGGWTTPGCSPR